MWDSSSKLVTAIYCLQFFTLPWSLLIFVHFLSKMLLKCWNILMKLWKKFAVQHLYTCANWDKTSVAVAVLRSRRPAVSTGVDCLPDKQSAQQFMESWFGHSYTLCSWMALALSCSQSSPCHILIFILKQLNPFFTETIVFLSTCYLFCRFCQQKKAERRVMYFFNSQQYYKDTFSCFRHLLLKLCSC